MPISINNKEDFNFNNVMLDISSSKTTLGLQLQTRSPVSTQLKLYSQLVASVRSGILYT
jgi:hypothetical protein